MIQYLCISEMNTGWVNIRVKKCIGILDLNKNINIGMLYKFLEISTTR